MHEECAVAGPLTGWTEGIVERVPVKERVTRPAESRNAAARRVADGRRRAWWGTTLAGLKTSLAGDLDPATGRRSCPC